MKSTYLIAVGATLVCGLPGQNESRGLLSGAATTFAVDGGHAANPDARTLVQRNGFMQGSPMTFPALQAVPIPALPELQPDLGSILAQWGAPPALDIDDYSTGRDELLFSCDGTLAVPPNSWSVWSFSLTTTAVGEAGSVIAEEALNGDVGAALFSYVLPNGSLPDEVEGETLRSHSRRDLGLNVGDEVDGIDFQLILGLDQGLNNNGAAIDVEPGFASLIPATPRFYFTVSSATKHLVPAPWWSGTPQSGASVFCSTWLSPTAGWSRPFVFRPFFDLGLGQNDDIDALAYDFVNDRILFSLVGTSRDQFLTINQCVDGPMVEPIKLANGNPVSESVGKGTTDDVDAVCTLDPTRPSGGPPPLHEFGNSVGSPRPGLLGIPQVSAAAYRRYEGGVTHFDTFMSGWPPVAGPDIGLAAVWLTSGNNLDYLLVDVFLRNPGNPQVGDPQSATVVIPPALALTGMPFTFRWAAIDLVTVEIGEAWPVEVFL